MKDDKSKAEEAAAKAAEDDGLVELTNGVDTVRAHPNQVAQWGKSGYFPVEVEDEQ